MVDQSAAFERIEQALAHQQRAAEEHRAEQREQLKALMQAQAHASQVLLEATGGRKAKAPATLPAATAAATLPVGSTPAGAGGGGRSPHGHPARG